MVPEMFLSSTRTFLPAGYRFDKCCWAWALPVLSAASNRRAGQQTKLTLKRTDTGDFKSRGQHSSFHQLGAIQQLFPVAYGTKIKQSFKAPQILSIATAFR